MQGTGPVTAKTATRSGRTDLSAELESSGEVGEGEGATVSPEVQRRLCSFLLLQGAGIEAFLEFCLEHATLVPLVSATEARRR